jgi:hypothetical protein
VPLPDLANLLDTFDTARVAAMNGGGALTAAKNAARDKLLAALRKTARYAQVVVGQNEALVLAAGFSIARSGRRPSTRLEVPLIVGLDNEGTTKFNVRLQSVAHARCCEVRAMNGATVPAATMFSTRARRIILGNLVPGTMYNVQARAIGGCAGFSDWSDPVSHVAI